MAMDAANEENFNTRNSEEAKSLSENLSSSNSTKNAYLDRNRLVEKWMEIKLYLIRNFYMSNVQY